MNRPTGLNVFIHLRKSRKDIEEEKAAAKNGDSYDTLERHRKRIFEVVKREKHNVIDRFEEVITGENIADRPEMQSLLRRVENGEVDAVLVVDLDRLGRGDMLDQGMIDRAFRYSNTKIITPTEYYDPQDDSWELVFGVKSIISRQELKLINKRLYNGRVDSVKEGRHIGKKAPYGYKKDESLILSPDPDTEWIVKQIFQWTIDGKGRRVIADDLNDMGIDAPAGKGKKWSYISVRNIIQNEVYQGDIVWGKRKYTKKNSKYESYSVPSDQWKVKKDAHLPIVSRELFKKANDIVSSRYNPPTSEHNKLVNAMAGILQCKKCGYAMWRIKSSYKSKDGSHSQAAFMLCTNSECRKRKQNKGAPYYQVENALIKALERLVEQFRVLHEGKASKATINIKPLEKVLSNKQDDLLQMQTQLDNIHDLLERGVYDLDKFMQRQNLINDRIQSTRADIMSLEQEIEREKTRAKHVKEVIPTIINVIQAYKSTDDVLTKNRLLKSILEKATYYREPTSSQPDDFTIELYTKI